MTELIGICAGAHPVHRRDNLKSSEELRSCQKQMARACLARRKLTQLGVTPQGEERYQSAWCSRPLGEPMCIIPTVPGLPRKGEIQSSECVVFTPPRGANVHHPY